MPITGTPSSSTPRSRRGAPGAYTDAGPPERITPHGLRSATSSLPPAIAVDRSATGAVAATRSVIDERGCLPVRGAHPDALVALERLALGLERGRDHDLRAVELGEVLVAARRHRRAQAAEQVERAVVLARGPDED